VFRMRGRRAATLGLVFALLASAQLGCAGSKLLARERVQDGPWKSFDEAKSGFDRIVPGETTLEELAALRFDPDSNQASTLISYIDVRQAFVPNDGISLEDASPGVRRCVDVRERCTAWLIALNRERRKRIGNAFFDWFLFYRVTKTTGWRFDALILIEDGRVLYKIWSGVPRVVRHRHRLRPLGFLQEIVAIVPAVLTLGTNTGDSR